MRGTDKSRLGIVAVFSVGALAAVAAFLSAQPYPGATVDSGEYLAVADGIANGHGLTMPYVGYDEPFRVLEPGERVTMTQFPPMYPALLAATRTAGLTGLDGARLLATVSFALTGWAVAALVLRESGRAWPVFTAEALLLSADLVIIHAMAWSETVMLAAFVGALAFAIRYLRSGRSLDLIVAGGWAVVASSARFVGLAAVAAIMIGIVASSRGNVLDRLVRALFFGAACVLPTAAWFLRNASTLGSPSEKELGLYVPGWDHVVQALSTFGGWFVPWQEAAPLIGAFVLLGAIAVAVPRVRRGGEPWSAARVCAWFGVSYLAFVLLSRTVLDQNIAFDFRILSPLYVVLVIAACIQAPRFDRTAMVALVTVAVVSLGRGVVTVPSFSSLSVASYTGDAWKRSPTLSRVADTPGETMLITNAPDPIWIWHDRVAQIIPPRSSLYSGEPNEAYSRDLRGILAATRCRDALVVFFDQPTRKPRRYIEPLLVRVLGLEGKQRFADGEIYEVTEPRCGVIE